MKLLIVAMLLVSTVVSANTTDLRNFLYNGSTQSESFKLNTEKTRTEYRTVQVPSTCYRTVYRRMCRQAPPSCQTVCRHGQCRNICRPGGTICREYPTRIPYSCMRTERRAYQVHDYYVETNVAVNYKVEDASLANERFTIAVTGERAKFSVNSSKQYMIAVDKRVISESMHGNVKYIDIEYQVKLISAKNLNSALSNGIQNVTLKRGLLTFSLGEGFNFEEFRQNLKVFQNRRLGRDSLLFNKEITENEAQVQTQNGLTSISIDLKSLNINVPSKIRIILDTEYRLGNENIINKADFKFNANANWIFR